MAGLTRQVLALGFLVPLVTGGVAALASPQAGGAVRSGPVVASSNATAGALVATERAIAQFERRVAETPLDYLSYSILGQLHARHSRETGNLDSYERAETAFRQALAANKDHLPAMLGLATALASEHQFHQALQLARSVQDANPNSVDALIVLGDASAEIGKYDEAEAAFKDVQIKVPNAPSVLARVAHLAELKGQHAYALELLQRAAATEFEEEGKGETAAWYQTRIGSLLYRSGKLDDASKSFENALRLFDGYYIALDGLADVRAAQGRVDEAIGLLERAVARVPQPGSLVFLGDLYMKKGRVQDAQRVHRQAEAITERPGSYQSAYRRERAMFYANHDLNLAQALDLARQDLDSRPDIYGYDALAWTLYKNKRFDEAAEAITRALAFGTEDATLFAHAGLIEHQRGRTVQALAYLNAANDVCPYLLDDATRALRSKLSGTPR